MQNKTLPIKIGNYLYDRYFCLYKRLYVAMKKLRDAAEIKLLKISITSGGVALGIGANIRLLFLHTETMRWRQKVHTKLKQLYFFA